MKKYLSLLLLYSFVLHFLFSCGTKPPGTQGSSTTPTNSQFEEQVLQYVNEHRRSKGLSPLKSNNVITVEAEKHSQRMATGKTPLGHDGFSSRIERISSQLGNVNQSAENVAYGSRTAKDVVSGWLNSPGHRQNIEGNFNLTGIGIARDKKGVLYFTQLFIRKSQ